MRNDQWTPGAHGAPLSRRWVSPAWEPRVEFRFRLCRPDGTPAPEAVAAVRAMTDVMTARRRGEAPSPQVMARWAKAHRAAAFADRPRRRPYAGASFGVGELERLAVTAEACMRYAAVVLELRDARLRDRSI